MDRRVVEIVLSGMFVFVAGYAVWPPEHVYWTGVAEVTGVFIAIGIVMALCGIVGAAVVFLTGVSLVNFSVGASSTYVIGIFLLDRTISPLDATEYVVLYGILLLCFVLGAVCVVLRRRGATPPSLSPA